MRDATMRIIGLLLLLVVPLKSSLAASDMKQTYSDVEYVEESGDRVGIEVQLTIEPGGKITGVLLNYQGLDAEPIALIGQLSGNTVAASGSMADARVTIDARIVRKRLIGTIRYHLSRQVNEFEINLPRVNRSRAAKE